MSSRCCEDVWGKTGLQQRRELCRDDVRPGGCLPALYILHISNIYTYPIYIIYAYPIYNLHILHISIIYTYSIYNMYVLYI